MSIQNIPERLPIFRVSTPKIGIQRIAETYAGLFGMRDFKARESGSRLILESGRKVVETNLNSGGIWAADKAQLWQPEQKADLISEDEALEMANQIVEKYGLLPDLEDSPFVIDFNGFGRTLAVFSKDDQDSRPIQLDTQVNYAVKLKMDGIELPVVGGGGEFNLTFGNGGQIINYSGVWRNVEEAVIESNVIHPEEAKEMFYARTRQFEIVELDTSLAYFAAPMRAKQEFLYPVYVHRAIAQIGEERVPLRIMTQPATEFGPFIEPPKPQPKRTTELAPGVAVKYKKPVLVDGLAVAEIINPYEAGTSWIGLSGGLSGSQNNAKGFVDGLADAGWNVNFNWGDGNAWESDWRSNDDQWVDAADFVFYTGHANKNGWVLSSPDDGFLRFSELSGGLDLWGRQDLEWVIVAACGPLQDDIINPPGGGNVFSRWRDAFDGLHQLLGYGAVTYDNTEEGASVIEYARDGDPIIDAWFRTAKEIQPATNNSSGPDGPTIYVGVMYAYESGTTSPRNDHIWGHGSVAPDPTNHNVRVCMWTTT